MPELVAVVDLGSTAVRLLLARIVPGTGYRVLAEERVPTRLGGGAPGRLPRAAIDDTLRAVHRFIARYTSKRQGPRIVAVATSAVRDARTREMRSTCSRLQTGCILADGRSVRIRSAEHQALRSQERLYETTEADGIVA